LQEKANVITKTPLLSPLLLGEREDFVSECNELKKSE
jgi:hypothetical protein